MGINLFFEIEFPFVTDEWTKPKEVDGDTRSYDFVPMFCFS